MDNEKEYFAFLFQMMVKNYESTTYISLGKIANPATGKIEKNLKDAKLFIDMLRMLKEKTAGNLSEPEKSQLEIMLTNLQLNYIEEQKKASEAEEDKNAGKKREDKQPVTQNEGEQEEIPKQEDDKKKKKKKTKKKGKVKE